MAVVAKAAGHGNLSTGNWVPEIWSQKVLKFFRKASVVEDVTNTDYAGEISSFGDKVNIIKEPVITVAAYARGQKLSTQDLADDEVEMQVDKANAFQFKVDDIEERQSHVNWQALSTSSGAYKLKDTFDSEVLDYMRQNAQSANYYGSTGSPIDTGFAAGEVDPLTVMARLQRLLDDNDVPEENRFLVAAPIFWEQVSDVNSKLLPVEVTGDNQSPLRNGRVFDGLIRGFRCYKTNNAPKSGTTWYGVVSGHMSSTATASQIAKTEAFRDPDSFADIVRGLHLYGRKVIRPEALAVAYVSID
jgi:hypothetical protein|tara:strand:- start:3196 stop:4101 length:906 start_codon:yes stop_codon:yes gene_type:complete